MRELLAIATKNLLQRYPRQGVGIYDNSIGCLLRRKSPGHLCPRQGPTCFRTIHLHAQLAAPFGAMRQTGLALFRTLEPG